MSRARQVLGVDVARGKWMAVLLEDGRFASARLCPRLARLLEEFPDAEVVAVDVPIGYPEAGAPARAAEVSAWEVLPGVARKRLFPVPAREVLAAEPHADASALSRRLTGKGISVQTYALRDAIFEVEAARAQAGGRVVEVHPELSFLAMACRPRGGRLRPGDSWAGIAASKKSYAGARARQDLLATVGLELPADLGPAGLAPLDDVLDATAAAWSAWRHAQGRSQSFPPKPGRGPAIRY